MRAAGARFCPPLRSPGERHPLTGEILAVDLARHQLTVRHDPIGETMPAMTMEFAVSVGDAAAARVGERIRGDLVLDPAGGTPHLEKIWPDDRAAAAAVAAGARSLREDTHDRGGGAYREVGEAMPQFTLYDQSGKVVASERFRGKQIMLNFIFTRCPVANMCPAATAKMMATQRLAREAGVRQIEFVSITLDPTYDTLRGPEGICRRPRGIDTGCNYSFLTGPESGQIRDLLTQFGVIARVRGRFGQAHPLATLLIDARGRIILAGGRQRVGAGRFRRENAPGMNAAQRRQLARLSPWERRRC